uniref:CSON000156 protein n=1 Tax=Culicoides sonorensis TaxID=179676 RepID=A0A336K8A1_CULSO
MILAKFIFLLNLISALVNLALCGKTKFIQVQKYRNCSPNDTIINTENVNVTYTNKILKFSGFVEISDNLNDDLRLTRVLKRCSKDDILAPCENFSSTSEKNLCRNLNNLKFYGKDFFSNFQPQFQCPLQKGVYNLSKAFIDTDEYLKLPVEDKEWRQQIKVFSLKSDQLIYCAEWSIRVLAQSSRKSIT